MSLHTEMSGELTAMPDDQPFVLEQIEDRILTITLNRPYRHNALLAEMSDLIGDTLAKAAENDAIDVIVLTGAGCAFCVGGDLDVMEQKQKAGLIGASEAERLIAKATSITGRLLHMPKPTIAMVNGAAAGGGLALALACDFRVASTAASFTFAYTKVALSGDFGTTWFVRRLLGYAKAREFCLTSPKVDADEALRIGLVNRIAAPDTLLAETRALAAGFAGGPRGALAAIKQNLEVAETTAFEEAIEVEARNFVATREAADHREAVRAFIEKRPPVYPRG